MFTSDAQPLRWKKSSRWVRGDEAMIEITNQVAPLAFRYEPNRFELDGDLGYVAGSVVVSDVHALDFLLALRKERDGWRIVADDEHQDRAPLLGADSADKVIADLGDAGIRRAIVLAVAFWMNDYEKVRAENDWTAVDVRSIAIVWSWPAASTC